MRLRKFWASPLGSDTREKENMVGKHEELCFYFDKGALGLRRLNDVNVALLCKWIWLFLRGKDKLWIRIIKEKYEVVKNGWFTRKIDPYYDVSL